LTQWRLPRMKSLKTLAGHITMSEPIAAPPIVSNSDGWMRAPTWPPAHSNPPRTAAKTTINLTITITTVLPFRQTLGPAERAKSHQSSVYSIRIEVVRYGLVWQRGAAPGQIRGPCCEGPQLIGRDDGRSPLSLTTVVGRRSQGDVAGEANRTESGRHVSASLSVRAPRSDCSPAAHPDAHHSRAPRVANTARCRG